MEVLRKETLGLLDIHDWKRAALAAQQSKRNTRRNYICCGPNEREKAIEMNGMDEGVGRTGQTSEIDLRSDAEVERTARDYQEGCIIL